MSELDQRQHDPFAGPEGSTLGQVRHASTTTIGLLHGDIDESTPRARSGQLRQCPLRRIDSWFNVGDVCIIGHKARPQLT
jgi:hypothetical protein